jgi:hypothetical protein
MAQPSSFLKQSKITDYFSKIQLTNAQQRANRKLKKRIAQRDSTLTSKKVDPKPSTYVPPHRRNPPVSDPAPKAKPKAKVTEKKTSSSAPRTKLTPKPEPPRKSKTSKPDTQTKAKTAPSNAAIEKALKSSSAPRFFFEKESRPKFGILFPSTQKPEVTLQFGTPMIDKTVFSKLLQSRLSAAHTVLEAKGLNRPRLPQDFVKSQIHMIQSSLRPRAKKTKKVQQPAETPARKGPSAPQQLLPSLEPRFVPARTSTPPPPVTPPFGEESPQDVKYDTDISRLHVNIKVAKYLQANIADVSLIDSYKAKVLDNTTLRLLFARIPKTDLETPNSVSELFIRTYAPHLIPMLDSYVKGRQSGVSIDLGSSSFHQEVESHIRSLETTLALVIF